MIIIDHNFAHLFELCDRVNVMQGGRITIDQLTNDTSLEELTELMVSSYRSPDSRGSERPDRRGLLAQRARPWASR